MNNLTFGTIWHWEKWQGKEFLKSWTETNLVVLEGRNNALELLFGVQSQITNWYVALFSDDHTPAAGDSYNTPGYTEFTGYDGANRPGFQPGNASAAVIDNSANRASFTFNTNATVYGAALVGGFATKGDTDGGGILFCESKFSASESVISAQTLKVKIEVTLTAS